MKKLLKFLFALILLIVSIFSCKEDAEESPDPLPQVFQVYLGNDTTIINNETFTIDASNDGAVFLWSTGEVTREIIIITSGKYWVTVTKDNQSLSDTIQVTFQLFIELGDTIRLPEGETILLTVNIPGASYLWSTGETTSTIEVDTGIYWVNATRGELFTSDTVKVLRGYKTILVTTDFGNFRIWLYEQTSLHRENFIGLTEQGFYDSLLFHRVVYDFVIQGGDPEGTGYGGPGYTIPAEIIDTLHHVYGTVGAARMPDNINPERKSNGSQFYIVCDPDGEPFLDGKYTVFGYVFSGMETVFNISLVPVDTNDRPLTDVFMKKLSIEKYTANELKTIFGFTIP